MARKLWLRHQPACRGRVRIDDGACRALAERGASLLPGGVVGVEGDFSNPALVDLVSRQVRRIGRGMVEDHASDPQRIAIGIPVWRERLCPAVSITVVTADKK